jgi:hypothetical protein
MRVQSLLRTVRPAVAIAGLMLLIGGIASGTAAAQAGKPVPKVSPQLPSSIAPTRTIVVQVGTVREGQTIDRPVLFNPRPSKGVMNVSGSWSRGIVATDGDNSADFKLKVTVKSPSGAIVASGCGFSSDSTQPVKTQLHANGMANETVSLEPPPPPWTVSVEICEPPLSEFFLQLSNVRIRIDY